MKPIWNILSVKNSAMFAYRSERLPVLYSEGANTAGAIGRLVALFLFSLLCVASSQGLAQSRPQRVADPFSASLPWDARNQYYEQIPSDRSIFDDEMSPFDRLLKQIADQSWIQVDYTLWNLDQSNYDIIGESVLDVTRPDFGYVALDRFSGTQPETDTGQGRLGYAQRLSNIDLNSMNGVRLKYGLETTTGTFEASTHWIFQTTRSFSAGPFIDRRMELVDPTLGTVFPQIGTIPTVDPLGVTAIPFLRDGDVTNRALIFDTAYSVSYDTSLFNTEINFIWDDLRPINGLHWKFLFGFRYLKLDEQMTQVGVDQDLVQDSSGNDILLTRNATIVADLINQIYGPQIGTRFELVDRNMVLGVQPAITLSSNHIDSRVSTDDLFLADNPTTAIDESTPPTTDKSASINSLLS